jgi:hypothetical protein
MNGEWIDARDRQPEDDRRVLVWAPDWQGGSHFGRWYAFAEGWSVEVPTNGPTVVTHWMPAPEPPGGMTRPVPVTAPEPARPRREDHP